MKARKRIAKAALLFGSFEVIVFVLAFAWLFTVPGRNQAITEEVVVGRLWKGMKLSEVPYNLGVPKANLETERMADGHMSIIVSRPGIVGSYLMPQREITLSFDDKERLVDAFCMTTYVLDEEGVSLPLRDKKPARPLKPDRGSYLAGE